MERKYAQIHVFVSGNYLFTAFLERRSQKTVLFSEQKVPNF